MKHTVTSVGSIQIDLKGTPEPSACCVKQPTRFDWEVGGSPCYSAKVAAAYDISSAVIAPQAAAMADWCRQRVKRSGVYPILIERMAEAPARHPNRLSIGCIFLLCSASLFQAFAQPTFSVGSADGWQGGTTTLELRLSGGTEPYAGVNAAILLPPGVTTHGLTMGDLLSDQPFISDYRMAGTNELAILAYSETNTFTGSGSLVQFAVGISDSAPIGRFPISFKNDSGSVVKSHALANRDGSSSVAHATLAGSLEIFSSRDDSDSDGFSDRMEVAFGTNPRDASSTPKTSCVKQAGGFEIVFSTSGAGRKYKVLYSDRLLYPNDFAAWSVLAENVTGTGERVRVTDAHPVGAQRFYAVLLQ